MALRNLYHSQTSSFSMEDIEITHAMTLKEADYSIKHELNPTTGTYSVKNKLGNKVMEFDNNLNLKSGNALHSHIQSKTQEVKDVTDTHATSITSLQTDLTRVQNQANTLSTTTTNNVARLTALEGVVSGGAGLEIDNILAIGNDADGNEIIGLSNVSSDKVTISGIELTSVEGVLTSGNNLYVPVLNTDAINCIGGGDVLLGKSIIDNSTMFAVRCNDNNIVSYSDAELVGFKTIDDMAGQITDLTNRVVVLEQYNTQLRNLILTISQSLDLVDAETGTPFNYTGLIPS
jgi:hypothetical protein